MKRGKLIITVSIILIAASCTIAYLIYNHHRPIPPQPILLRGYDISHHNTIQDWNAVKADFIVLKATEGRKIRDSKFKNYRKICEEHNIKVGAYHFFTTNSSPEAQFDNFYRTVGKDIDIVPIIDIEKMTHHHHISRRTHRKYIRRYADLCIKYYHKAPLIYCNNHWYHKYFENRFYDTLFDKGFEDCYFWNGNAYGNAEFKCEMKQTAIGAAKGFIDDVDYDVIYNTNIFFRY